MKRSIILLIALLVLLFGVRAVHAEGGFQYSNMVDAETQKIVSVRMKNAGILEERIKTSFEWIDDYNQFMHEAIELKAGFVENATAYVQYPPEVEIDRAWWDRRKDTYDFLCRFYAFQLMQDSIEIDTVMQRDSWDVRQMVGEEDGQGQYIVLDPGGWLQSDMNIVDTNPLFDWDEDTLGRYFTLFNPVQAKEGGTPDEQAIIVQKAWEEAGIRMTSDTVTLITMWMPTDTPGRIAIGHAAVLIEDSEGLLLLEKINPNCPYQATKYDSIDQMVEALRESTIDGYRQYDLPTPEMFILRNLELIG